MFIRDELFPGTLPERIISLVPSQTELLFDLGLEKEVVGITKFCVHPESWYRNKTRVGGTKKINFPALESLKPDLIIANEEENTREEILQLAEHYPVWLTEVTGLASALEMIIDLGNLTGRETEASKLALEIRARFAELPRVEEPPKTAYLIWKDPYITVGADTFISDMLGFAGFKNIFCQHVRYPETSIADLRHNGCELLLLSSEPFPFKEKHIGEIRRQLPETELVLVDGEMFSWYGSRLLQAPAYFERLQQEVSTAFRRKQ